MVLKFIAFVALCAVFLVFIGFNLENKCDISFGFVRLPDVPVFLTAFASFVLGLLASVPIAISIRIKKSRKRSEESRSGKKAGKNRAKGKVDSQEDALQGKAVPEEKESPYKDDGTYGID
ncbi:MAG: hypothetical protein LBK05_01585 [Treponema sp.]|jgi:uncharacterized integral membrane protein|nr:hypothetical protein [Treponema sp.]